jgi:hypothetical protein
MIRIEGSTRRSFLFPANLPTAYAYYSDVSRLLHYLPHISLVRDYGGNSFRMLYSTTELGLYRIGIFWDVQTTLDDRGGVIRVEPLNRIEPVESQVGLHSSTAQGAFSSQSVFHVTGDQTKIEYSIQLHAQLPTPLGLDFMPGVMVDRVAKSITNRRIREIAQGFIERSVAAFPHWLDEMQNHGLLAERLPFHAISRQESDS